MIKGQTKTGLDGNRLGDGLQDRSVESLLRGGAQGSKALRSATRRRDRRPKREMPAEENQAAGARATMAQSRKGLMGREGA